MREKKRLLVLFVNLAVAASFLIFASFPATAADAPLAKLTKIQGKVEVQAPGQTAWADAAEGMPVAEGTSVRTGAEGTAFLAWKKGHTVKLYPLTNLKVDESKADASGLENTKINISGGKIFARTEKLSMNSSFKVKTPTAVAGVRGSSGQFDLGPNPSITSGEGTWGVSAVDEEGNEVGEPVNLEAGFQLPIPDEIGAMLPEPAPAPPAVMSQIQADTQQSEEVAAEATAATGGEGEPEVDVTGTVEDTVTDDLTNSDIMNDVDGIKTGTVNLIIQVEGE